MASDVEWRWADPEGQQRLVREDELRAALASGLIPPNAPVWKAGWKQWQPAYSVPELTTSALAAANGLIPNIPPPPLGVLGAQKNLEEQGAAVKLGVTKITTRVEPPPPPRYVPSPTQMARGQHHAPTPPPSPVAVVPVSRAVTVMGVPPDPSSSRSLAAQVPAAPSSSKSVAAQAQVPPAAPSSKRVIETPAVPTVADKPADKTADKTLGDTPRAGSVADESNTAVRLTPLTGEKATNVLNAAAQQSAGKFPKTEKATQKGFPTAMGIPALPSKEGASASQSPPSPSNPPAPVLWERAPSQPPFPIDPKAMPPKKRSKTLLFGEEVVPLPPPDDRPTPIPSSSVDAAWDDAKTTPLYPPAISGAPPLAAFPSETLVAAKVAEQPKAEAKPAPKPQPQPTPPPQVKLEPKPAPTPAVPPVAEVKPKPRPQSLKPPPPQSLKPPPPKPGTKQPPPLLAKIEELSQSILVDAKDDRRDSSKESVVLTDSLREQAAGVASPPRVPPAIPADAGSGTLFGQPVPQAPPSPPMPAAPPSPPPTEPIAAGPSAPEPAAAPVPAPPVAVHPTSSSPLPQAGPSSRIVHDLRELLKTPRSRLVWQGVAAGGAVVVISIVGLLVSSARGKSREDLSTSSAPVEATASSPTPSAPAASPEPAAPKATLAPAPLLTPCALAGSSHTIAPRAVVSAGIEAVPAKGGIDLGFATAQKEAMAVRVDPASLTASASVRARSADAVKRVVPERATAKLAIDVETDARGARLTTRRAIPGPAAVDIGVADGAIVWAPHLRETFTTLWPLEGDDPVEALRGATIEHQGQKGIAVVFRRSGAIWMGTAFGESLTAKGPLYRIVGLGPVVGSPTIAATADATLIAWADRASSAEPWGVRLVGLVPGEAPKEPTPFRLPPGGLGEHVMSPALAATGPGRFLLAWTEGPTSGHQVRAQTISATGEPLGDPLTVSAEGANAGQPQSAVLSDGHGVIAFLSAKGKAYEVVAAPVHCPLPQ